MNIFDKNFKEIFFGEIASIIGGLIAGTMLALYTNNLLLIPGMLVALPGFLEMRGNISGSLASRISSGLFLRVIKPDRMHTKLVKSNLLASFFLATVVSLALGILAFLFNYMTIKSLSVGIIFLFLIAGVIANAIEIPLTLIATFFLFRKGHDPN